MECPHCKLTDIVRNGSNSRKKRKFMCGGCKGQFALDPAKRPVSAERKLLIGRLFPEGLSLAGIAGVAGVSGRWPQK